METDQNEYNKYAHMVQVASSERKEEKGKSMQRALQMAKLYFDEGLTYEVIGKRYGVSRQRVHQILAGMTKDVV